MGGILKLHDYRDVAGREKQEPEPRSNILGYVQDERSGLLLQTNPKYLHPFGDELPTEGIYVQVSKQN